MLGAIVGDIVGSIYEFDNHKSKDFPLFQERCEFTDDNILTIATADALMDDWDFASKYRRYGARYPSSYGGFFREWIHDESQGPYNGFGNGSAMRVSPVAHKGNREPYEQLKTMLIQFDFGFEMMPGTGATDLTPEHKPVPG